MCPPTGVRNIMKSKKFDKIYRLEKVFKKSSLYRNKPLTSQNVF